VSTPSILCPICESGNLVLVSFLTEDGLLWVTECQKCGMILEEYENEDEDRKVES
jgi:uncharacterized protein (DUF983 family)